jgi:hypothetical protein
MRRDRTSISGRPPRPTKATLQAGTFVRIVLLAIVAVFGSGWALARFYLRARAPIPVPAAPQPQGAGWDAGQELLPAPEIEREER